mgnify:FL=1
MQRILVTGGAGFIGSHVVDELVSAGYEVTVLDSLEPQVHGPARTPPPYLNPKARTVWADLAADGDVLDRLLPETDAVIHLAAVVGVSQSMYEISRYVRANTAGTAVLLEKLTRFRDRVRKLVVASSMSVYGEGAYRCPNCGPAYPRSRPEAQLAARDWEPRCPACSAVLEPRPTPEEKPLMPESVYAITKRDQEELALTVGRAYQIPTVALRFFNVYGPRQALSNPYTGVAAIFSARLLNGRPPVVYEDGRQTRDFVHVRDVARACRLALERDGANYEAVNIGTGRPVSVLEVARTLARALGRPIEPEVAGRYRAGDIRHCYADITRARRLLGFEPEVTFEAGMAGLAAWVAHQAAEDRWAEAAAELERRGLTR